MKYLTTPLIFRISASRFNTALLWAFWQRHSIQADDSNKISQTIYPLLPSAADNHSFHPIATADFEIYIKTPAAIARRLTNRRAAEE